MKIAFVMGFFDEVKTCVHQRFPEHVYRDRLIWIAQGKGMVTAFKSRVYDLVKTADGLLVCLGRGDAQKYLDNQLGGILEVIRSQYSTLPVEFAIFGNMYDHVPVVNLLTTFGLETQPQISSNRIRERVVEGKILCVSLDGKTKIFTALERAGFSPEAIEECFFEQIRVGARNSNLMEELGSCTARFSYLLYAFEGLRTITPDVKKGFKHGCHEARNAAQVVELFKKWILEGGQAGA